jgi:hypothetical protein
MYIKQIADFLDKTPWKSDDSMWVKQRKKEWGSLSKMLRDLGIFSSTDVRYYKNFYLNGELPEIKDELKDMPQHFSYVLLLMFYPLQSDESLKALYSHIGRFISEDDFQEQRRSDQEFFFHEIVARENEYETICTDGVLNGLEKTYCDLLYGESISDFTYIRLSNKFEGYCHKVSFFLLSDEVYINLAEQYLTDFSFYASKVTKFDYGAVPTYVGQFLQIIFYYELLDPFKGVDEVRFHKAWAVVYKVRAVIEKGNLPEELLEMWDATKSESGKTTIYKYFYRRFPILSSITN